ncbi:MAG TPA: glycosyl hydrolase [Polyangiaceae bacterium]|nr:glycosyl hydrolase [Polyangiaceae bacterium]
MSGTIDGDEGAHSGAGNVAGSSSVGTSGTATTAGGSNAAGGGNSAGSGVITPQGGTTSNGGSGSAIAGKGSGGSGTAGTASGGTSSGGSNAGGAGGSGGSGNPPHDCKRGIAWPGQSLTNAEVSSQLTWWYTWGLGIKSVGAGLEFVPMISGGGHNATNDNKVIRSDAKYLLGYNEPNFFAQANLSAAQAAADWPTVEAVAKAHNLKIVSPAVNYCGDDKNKTGPCHDTNPAHYLQTFFDACANCQVDYIAVHWYNCDGASLKSYLDMFKQFNRPIWLTEFACAYGGDTSVAGQEKYMREAIPILEGRADVFRYSWFSADAIPNAKLLNDDSSPTDLGKIYLSLPHDPTCTP